ncbi:MAG: PD40 domain-containing protein [Flavobacteriales bacterium]|nr:PD40 domain-containing protein [Flavobacteriales bacterium]
MIRKSTHKIILTVITLLLITVSSKAQYNSEEEKKTAANEMFANEDYVGAIKIFSQLLSTYPKDPSYNYKYGACVLYGSRDKDKALKYLKFAVTKSNVDPIAFYFLAKAYHHNYQFAPAVVNYNKYKGKTTTKEHQKYKIDREIKMCQNGEQLLKSITDIGVLSKKEIKATDFFRSYNLKGIGGKIIVKPDEFKTKLDKKNNENSVIYIGEKKDMVVYSSYGKGEATGKDIYRVVKLPDGGWSKPVSFSDAVNSEYDEDYPFLHPDGRTLYFSSKGYNSMGGYDIFKSTLDARTGKWSYPENLDFPINTPDDDILYISDIDNRLAYFASSRASKQGELTVYKVTVDAPPVENSIIKGFFLAESNPYMKSATITIRDVEKDKRYGVYKTHNETGEYLLVFPKNGGKFKILVETTNDAPVHSAIIELPVLDGFRALKQELRLVGEGDNEKLVVKNLFDESDEFDITDPLVVQNILKERAKLDVNTTEEELNNSLANSLNNALANQEESKSGYSEMSDDQIINKTDGIASKIIEQTKTSKEQANISYQIANEKSTKAKELYNEATALYNSGNNEEAVAKKMEAAKLINETVAALAIAKTLDNEVIERESDLEKVKSLQESVNNDIDNGNRTEAESNLEELDEIASATYHNESALQTEEDIADNNLEEKQKTYNKTRDNVTELLNREYELTETINKLEIKKAETKKKSEKVDIESRIQALTIDVEDTKFDLTNARSKAGKAENEYNKAKKQVETIKSVIASVEAGNNSAVPISESSKLQLENDIAYFEKEGLVGLYPSDEALAVTSNETYDLEEHKDEYKIIDDAGEIVDYNTTYGTELSEIGDELDPTERAHIIVKINESWIKDIGEEIAIRKNQLKAETNNAKRTDLEGKIASLEALKMEKQRELNEKTELIAENTTTNSTTTTPIINNNSTSVATNSVEEEVNIMNTDGSIIDYESKYTTELETFTEEDDFNSYAKKAAIHNNWASATEQEVLIKKMELAEANEGDKNGIENEIAVLENNLLEQQEFAALYDMQAESMRTTEPVTEEPIVEEPLADNEQRTTNSEEPIVEEPVINNEEPAENNEEPITNNEEPIEETLTTNNTNRLNDDSDNYEEKYTAELEAFSGEDDFDSYTKKAAIHTNWSKTIENEITAKEISLAAANEEDKNEIKNEIAVLENDYLEQQEFAALYDMQAESVRKTEPLANNEQPSTNNEDPIIEEPLTNNEDPATNSEEPIVEEPVINNEQPVVNNELAEENLTANNLNAPEDDFSNLKYNNNFNYKSTQSQNTLAPVTEMKSEARTLKDEAEIKLNTASATSSQEEKDKIITEADELTDKSNRKQEQVAKVYESANREEYYNNQAVISKLQSGNNDPYSNETIMTELFVEESDNYYEEAKQKREDAVNAPNFTAKQVALQKAYELEMKAIEKQKMAINQLSDEIQKRFMQIQIVLMKELQTLQSQLLKSLQLITKSQLQIMKHLYPIMRNPLQTLRNQ